MNTLKQDIEKRESFLLQGAVASQTISADNPSFLNHYATKTTHINNTLSEETFVSVKIENEQLKKDNQFLVQLL